MCKFITKIICLFVIIFILFIAISLSSGGKKFRWFGEKIEQQSERIGKEADDLKEKGDKVLKGFKKTKEKIKDVTGKKDEKSD